MRIHYNGSHFLSRLLVKLRSAPRRASVKLQAIRTLLSAQKNPILQPLIPEINKRRRSLTARYEALPLPDFLAELTPRESDLETVDPDDLRDLIDAVAQLDWRSSFGVCLRRSLLRYHFLRRTGLELSIVFGVRFRQAHEPAGIAGHAWNTFDGQPYHEREEDYLGFTVLYEWPEVRDQRSEGRDQKSDELKQ
jgi:hypothetical protein